MYRRSRDQKAATAIDDMQRRLSPVRNANPLAEAVRPIRYLREYSNYLTPKTGFLSADTWTMFGIFSRNAMLNQIILVSLFAGSLLLPRLAFKLTWMRILSRNGTATLASVTILLLCVCATVVLTANLRRLGPFGDKESDEKPNTMSTAAEPKVPKYARPFCRSCRGPVAPCRFSYGSGLSLALHRTVDQSC